MRTYQAKQHYCSWLAVGTVFRLMYRLLCGNIFGVFSKLILLMLLVCHTSNVMQHTATLIVTVSTSAFEPKSSTVNSCISHDCIPVQVLSTTTCSAIYCRDNQLQHKRCCMHSIVVVMMVHSTVQAVSVTQCSQGLHIIAYCTARTHLPTHKNTGSYQCSTVQCRCACTGLSAVSDGHQ
jgi:hypothetical protein